MTDRDRPAYPGGFPTIIAQMEGRRAPLNYGPGEALPPPDVDFAPLKTAPVDGAAPEVAGSTTSYARKLRELSEEFAGAPQLLRLHGLLVANLRRRDQPAHAADLFQRLWAEEARFLLAHLDARWLVSAVTTFGDHGQTEVQRRVGQALNMLFGTMKLYETERLFSGAAPAQAHRWSLPPDAPLALDMDRYAIVGGGLDVNLLGRLWQEAGEDPVIAPLAGHLLELLIRDERTVFARLRRMRARRKAHRAAARTARPAAQAAAVPVPAPASPSEGAARTPRWGIVTLVRAPLTRIARFAAYHIVLGAERLYLHLDAPDDRAARFLSAHPAIEVITCDDAWWQAQGKPRMAQHQQRQLWVATRTYRRTDLDWLAHVDVDEFILPPAPMAGILSQADAGCAALRMPPVERLAGDEDSLFKTTARMAGRDSAVLEDIYPTFGPYLRGGYLGHLEGKLIARTGLADVRLGVHALLRDQQPVTNVATHEGLFVGHAHAPDWDTFRANLDFRLAHGAYREDDADPGAFRRHDMLRYLRDEEGEDGLRRFFHEVCEATPRLVSQLHAHDMLVRRRLELDAAVARVFGALPDE